jgi:Rrf2 family protein
MFYSTSCEYALRSLTHLALYATDSPVQVRDIAEAEAIPRHFLAKIMNQLTYKGLVKAFRGPGGGFLLSRPPEEMRVSEVIDAIDGVETIRRRCVLGLDQCRDDAPCPMHETWKRFRDGYVANVDTLTLAKMAQTLRLKRENVARESRRGNPA